MTTGAMKQASLVGSLVLCAVAACDRRGPGIDTFEVKRPGPPVRHMPLRPERMAQLLGSGRMELRSAERAPGGVMGVARAIAHFPDIGANVEVKWKEAPRGDADGWNNAPRKELAAWQVQRWFLEEDEYVVPPAALRCIPVGSYRAIYPDAEPTLPEATCVLGLLTAWLHQVEAPDRLYVPERFAADREYARALGNLNLLLYLIEHRDSRSGNILVSSDPRRCRIFSVDNGIAFGGRVYNFFRPHWNEIRVPALPRPAVDRLRAVGADQLHDLAVVAEMRADRAGVYRLVGRRGVLDPDRGVRIRSRRLQMGLTREETRGVAERLRALLARIDAGEIPLL